VRLDGGPPFGITDFPYPVEELTIRPGDSLILLTDGVTEAQNAKDELFGRDRILARVGSRTASETCEAVRDEVRAFEGDAEATDDLTVMAVRFLGPNGR